jgi:uncharacterized membrane protein
MRTLIFVLIGKIITLITITRNKIDLRQILTFLTRHFKFVEAIGFALIFVASVLFWWSVEHWNSIKSSTQDSLAGRIGYNYSKYRLGDLYEKTWNVSEVRHRWLDRALATNA